MRIRIGPVVALAAALALLLAACGGGDSGQAQPTATTAQADTSGQATATTVPASTTGMSGIVLATCGGAGKVWTLTAYDPQTGQPGEARAFDASSTAGPHIDCTGITGMYGTILRQMFDNDLSTMAATGTPDAEGSYHAGVVDTSGKFTDLSPDGSGYSGGVKQAAAMFNPADGRLWYYIEEEGYGSVDPKAGPGSSRKEEGELSSNWATGGTNAVYFTPMGEGPIPIAAASYSTFSPDGRYEVEYEPANLGFRVGRPGKVTDSTPVLPIKELCWPKQFVDGSSFLCLDSDEAQLYRVTIAAGYKLRQIPLLPQSQRAVQDMVVDPTGTKLAIISSLGSTTSLFVTSLDGSGGEPHEVAKLDSSTNGWLVDWS